MSPAAQKLLQIEDLVLHFKTSTGTVQAVDGVDFELDTNRAVVILGLRGHTEIGSTFHPAPAAAQCRIVWRQGLPAGHRCDGV